MERKKQQRFDGVKRAALYIRVSREEQKIQGLSLEAQQERLEEFVRERGWIIAGVYIDAAKTARKNIHKRLEFQKMIESVKRNEVDILLFCRLDRWFRSVADYYKVMEILQTHNCEWLTTDEQYDTTTASGRLYINMRLAIAQNEADLCGERIAVVFDSKIRHGTALSGKCPFGYRVNKEKRLEIVPEQAAIVQDAFRHYKDTVSQRGTVKYIREKYGVDWAYVTLRHMLRDCLYIGRYEKGGRFNENFCPAIIPQELFEEVQQLLPHNARSVPSGRVYLFTSLLKCAECGYNLVGVAVHGYLYYRCNQYMNQRRCTHKKSMREDMLEKWLFDNLAKEIERYQCEWELKEAAQKQTSASIDKAALKRKLSKLKELYVNELIDIEEYKKDYEVYIAALHQISDASQETPPDFSAAKKLTKKDFRHKYDNMTREEKERFGGLLSEKYTLIMKIILLGFILLRFILIANSQGVIHN